MNLLITGGTGSLGTALINYLASHGDYIERFSKVIVLSRDELKQAQMKERFREYPQLQFFLGDVRDLPRLKVAFSGVHTVIHAAALKRVDSVCFDPTEVKKTNIDGTENVLEAALYAGVARVLLVSSDKACYPTNVYGASKNVAECLTTGFNTYSYPKGTRCSVVRYGNVFNSRGSVMEIWSRLIKSGHTDLPITDTTATRFLISLDQAVHLILYVAIRNMQGGEIFVPKLPTFRLVDLLTAFGGHPSPIPLRPGGEKLHEVLLTQDELTRAEFWKTEIVPHYTIYPHIHPWRKTFMPSTHEPISKSLGDQEDIRSDNTDQVLSMKQLHTLIQNYCK